MERATAANNKSRRFIFSFFFIFGMETYHIKAFIMIWNHNNNSNRSNIKKKIISTRAMTITNQHRQINITLLIAPLFLYLIFHGFMHS